MPVDGQASLVAALEAKRFDDVTGTPESEWVDFKRSPYSPDHDKPQRLSERGKWELCKDVAAFANAKGGSLVLGFKDEINATQGVAVAGEMNPIPFSRIDINHYRDVLQHGTYPLVAGVELIWFPEAEGADAGVLLISIPPSDDSPHVLRKLVTENEERIEAVGVPIRTGDRTIWYSAEGIHHLLRQGERASSSTESADAGARSTEVWLRADENRDRVIELLEWEEKAVYILQAVPAGGPPALSGFFDEVKDALERPASLRPAGFNMRGLGGVVDVVAGSLVVRRMGDAAAWLDRDGLLTVAVLASPEFLGWSINRDPQATVMKINSIVLVELTLEFCRFVHNVLKPRAGSARWEYRVECLRFQTASVALAPGSPRQGHQFSTDFRNATADQWSKPVPDSDEPGEVAFELLSHTYALFGLPESEIPYVIDRRVDSEMVSQIGITTP